jgi:hypothetical protein
MKRIFNYIKGLFSQKSEADLATLALIEKWEREELDGEFSHFYYENIR